MAIKYLSTGWKADLKDRSISSNRVYIDFRREEYPPYASDLSYTVMTSGDNQPGSHNLTGGHATYLLELTDPVTIRARVYPNFVYNVGSNQYILSWYRDSTHYLILYYRQAPDSRYQLDWKDGDTVQSLNSTTYTDNSHQAWTDIDIVLDFTNKTGALYINRSLIDDTWSGTMDTKSSNVPLFCIRHYNGTEGNYKINHVRVFPNLEATATQIANDYKDVTNEEIVWHFNGEGVGRTRCNVTRFVENVYTEKSVESFDTGAAGANSANVTLLSTSGEFADDQYAAFDPTSDSFNGTSSQKYMQNRCRLEIETWYSNVYDFVFTGQIEEGGFSRLSAQSIGQRVTVNAYDMMTLMDRKFVRKAKYFENHKIASTTDEANSLAHDIPRLATKDDIYNFAANSSFENATIGNSWILGDTGTGATLNRAAGGLFGSYEGQLSYGDALCAAYQDITFIGNKKLNVGETWSFSIWLKCASAVSNANSRIWLVEKDDAGENDTSSTIISLSGDEGWDLFSVSHTITDSDSNKLRIRIYLNDNITLSMDGVMLIQNDRALNWFILNSNDGTGGVESADDAVAGSYDHIGFDVEDVDITHPWALIPQGGNVGEHVRMLGDAVAATYNGLDEAGTYILSCKLSTESDPTSLETIDENEFISIETAMEIEPANKIEVHGIRIEKSTNESMVWGAAAAGAFQAGSGVSKIAETVSTGKIWPTTGSTGVDSMQPFWAKYGQV